MKIIASKFECSGIAESIDGVVQSIAAKLLANSQTAGRHNLLCRIEFVSRDLQLRNLGGGLRLHRGERHRQDANREEADAKVNWCHAITKFHRKSVKRSFRNCQTGRPKEKACAAVTVHARKLLKTLLADVAVDGFGDLVLGDGADDLFDDLAILENENRGDAADVVAARGVHGFVHVEFHDLDFARVVVRDFCDGGGEHMTRTAPFRPKIDEYGLRFAGRKYFVFKISIRCRENVFRHILLHQRLSEYAGRLSPLSG